MNVSEFQTIVMPVARKMWLVAHAMLRNDDDARDAVQDTLTQLWGTRNRLNSVDNVEAFCISCVKNAALTRLRRQKFCTAQPPPDFAEPAHDPLRRIDDCSELSRLRRLMLQLSPDQQRAISLSADCALSNEEIAQATGWSPAKVRALLSRGRKQLKELYNNPQQ